MRRLENMSVRQKLTIMMLIGSLGAAFGGWPVTRKRDGKAQNR